MGRVCAAARLYFQSAMADLLILLDDLLNVSKNSGRKWSKENVSVLLEDTICYVIRLQNELKCEDRWYGH